MFHPGCLKRGVRLALLLGLWVSFSGLAAQSFAQVYGGMLRVTNNTAENLNVLVDGQMLGQVAPGQTAVFNHVPAGYKGIVLTNPFGQVRSNGRFFLPINGSYTWTVGASAYAIGPAPLVPVEIPRGSLQIYNRFLVPANIFIGERPRGTILPGQTAVYYNLRVGTRVLRALTLEGMELYQQTVNIVPGSRTYVNLTPQVGFIRVVNSRPEPLEILLDGAPVPFLLQPGRVARIPNVRPGTRSLIARVGGVEVQRTMAPVYAGQTYTWYVRAPSGNIRVVNQTGEILVLNVDGNPQGTIGPGQERILPDLPAGLHKLFATDSRGTMRNPTDLLLGQGETRLWLLDTSPGHEAHPHDHPHPHPPGQHHHHPHLHPHAAGLDHHHPTTPEYLQAMQVCFGPQPPPGCY
jgi:hypothetical protein